MHNIIHVPMSTQAPTQAPIQRNAAVHTFLENLTGSPSELHIINCIYRKLYKGTTEEFAKEYHVNAVHFAKFLQGEYPHARSIVAFSWFVQNYIGEHSLPQVREEAYNYIYSLITQTSAPVQPVSYKTPIPFSLSLQIPTDGVRIVVFVDGDQLYRAPPVADMFKGGAVSGVHFVIVVARPDLQIQIGSDHVTYVSCHQGLDSTDNAISMLLALYLSKHPIKYYIVTYDNFAYSVVRNIGGDGKVIRAKKYCTVIANLCIDIYLETPDVLAAKFQEYAKAILRGVELYKGYHLARYLIVNDLVSLPPGISRFDAISAAQHHIPSGDKEWPYIPFINKYKYLLNSLKLPVSVMDVSASLTPEESRFFGVARFENLFGSSDVCDAMGVAIYLGQIHPPVVLQYKGEIISETTLREMVRAKMIKNNHNTFDVITKYHAKATTFNTWINSIFSDHEIVDSERYHEHIYAVLLSAVMYINSN